MNIERRHIPEEIIAEEIVARLPVKSVLRFRSVSKAWCCLIGSERFIETHLKKFSEKNKARGCVFSKCLRLKQYSVESLLKEPIKISSRRRALVDPMWDISVVDGLVCMSSWPPQTSPWGSVGLHLVGCCNGLVCLNMSDRGRGRFFLWNPSTRISKKLPIGRVDVSSYGVSAGFGWDESSGAYKVCAYKNDPGIEVYSSKTNSWKTVDRAFEFCGKGQFVSGKLYWLRKRDIVWFDMKSEEFGVMELPTQLCERRVLVGEHEGCLCVVSMLIDRERRLDVWVMKENESNWFHMVVAASLFLSPHHHERECSEHPHSFIAAPDGQIWLCYEKSYLPYDPKHDRVFPLKYGLSEPHICLQSLVRP